MGIDRLWFIDNDDADVFAGDLRYLVSRLGDDELVVAE
jgi:hypothetical protein